MNTYVREVRRMMENLGLVRRSDSSWSGAFLMGAGFGVIAGAAAAALLTPSSGKEMRKLFGRKAKALAISAERTISAHPRHNGAREHHT